MPYKHGMKNEKPPKRLLEKGWRNFKVIACNESESKGGNPMFVINLLDEETSYVDTIYAISTEGKRWVLKNLLTACGVEAGQDGVYEWDIADILDKDVKGLVDHEPNKYINRNGDEVETIQHRIVEFQMAVWDE